MIGHLQSRKAPIIARCFQMIHSIDSLDLAKKLDHALNLKGKSCRPCWRSMSAAKKASSAGRVRMRQDWDALLPDFEQVLSLKNLRIQGSDDHAALV